MSANTRSHFHASWARLGHESYLERVGICIFLTTKDTKITKKSTEIIAKAFLRVLRALRGELLIKVRPQGAGAKSSTAEMGVVMPAKAGIQASLLDSR
jgi:hypothetical protein